RAGTTFDGLTEACERIVPVRRARGLDMAAQAELAAAPYDLAHLEGAAALMVDAPLPLPTVIDAGTCAAMRRERAAREGGLLLRLSRAAQAARARRCQRAAAAHGARILVAAPDDAWAFRALEPAPPEVYVVPSPVDLEHFAPPAALREQAGVLLDLRGLDRAEAVAAMGLAHATMARVWAQRADARLTVLGRAPFGGAGRLAGDGRVTFTGAASDPRGHLAGATLALAPLLPGAAPAHAPLEAMATATPVVVAPAVAHELGAIPGHEVVAAAGAAAWADAILGLLDDPPYRGRLGRAGRRLVELRHGPRVVTAALENVYAATIGSPIAEWRMAVGLGAPRLDEDG
ncbi:MAG TPA: glycosyltransferase, partial [Chloroflexaceae bacterium]|nr:glycosyltransferase [Chloroflexaceae bacterium]